MTFLIFITAPSLAYSYILSKAPPRSITVCSERSVDAFIRQSQQGGRCFPQKGYFFSEDCQAILDAWNNHDNAKLKFLYENCSDFLRVLDAVSLYPSAMWKFEYPSGTPYWEHDDEMVVNALNNRDTNLKLGIVECEITINPNQVCPLLSHKSPDGRLRYSTECNQRVIKTTIYIMEAVRYNGARVTRVFNALFWTEKTKIFSEAIKTLFETRKHAKEIANVSLSIACKLMMNSGYGKLGQKIRETKTIISGDNDNEIHNYYKKDRVISDKTLNNKRQCLLETTGLKPSRVKDPAHLNSFILAYSKVLMNEAIDAIDGFTDWDKTFYYTDTDSIYIHNKQVIQLEERRPDLIGKELCQLHDDITEVINGKIFEAIFIRPKLYILGIVGFSKKCPHCNSETVDEKKGKYICSECKNGEGQAIEISNPEVEIQFHVRAKGIKKDRQDELKFENFENMLFKHEQLPVEDISRFARNFKDADEPAIKTVVSSKIMNKDIWDGRKWNEELNRFEPTEEHFLLDEKGEERDLEEDENG